MKPTLSLRKWESYDAVELILGSGLRQIVFRNYSNMAWIRAKLCQNAFRTTPGVSFFDASTFFSAKFSDQKFIFFADLAWFLASHGRTDVKISLLVEFCSR